MADILNFIDPHSISFAEMLFTLLKSRCLLYCASPMNCKSGIDSRLWYSQYMPVISFIYSLYYAIENSPSLSWKSVERTLSLLVPHYIDAYNGWLQQLGSLSSVCVSTNILISSAFIQPVVFPVQMLFNRYLFDSIPFMHLLPAPKSKDTLF